MSDEYTTQVPNNVANQLTHPTIYWRAAALGLMLAATVLLASVLIGSSAAQPIRPPYLKGAALASGVIQPHAQASSSNPTDPNIVITDIVPMTMPETYLGVGSQLAVDRHTQGSNGDNSPMRLQNFWLSMHSPGTPKENGDPFTAKWDQTSGGCNCWPVGGPFQPDHDNQGYDYALYVPDGTDGYLQIYDAAYQPKPGYNDVNGRSHINPIFSQSHPCGDPNRLPGQCGGGLDFNNINTRWCANNAVETGDNEPGTSPCDTQVVSATTVYSLYYPDSTPNYFGDDVLAASWVVPASPISGTEQGGVLLHSYVYSQTWTNFAETPDPGYHIYPMNGNHQWRLNTNVPFDGDHTINGTKAQNNYAIRLKTTDTSPQVFPIRRVSTLNNVPAGSTDFYLGEVLASQSGRTLVVSLFDPGDASGNNYLQLISPPTASNPTTHTVFFDAYIHDKNYPPSPDIVITNTDILTTTRPQYDMNDKWVDLVYHIPDASEYLGGYFQLQYVFQAQTQDRITWWMSISDNDPFTTPTITPTGTNTDTPTNTPTITPSSTPTNTPTPTNTATPSYTPTNTPVPPTNTPTSTNTPISIPSNTPAPPTNTPTSTPTPCNGFGFARTDYPTGRAPTDVKVGDFNGDGKLDLVVPNYTADTISILLGNGDGTFQAPHSFATSHEPYALVTADFNHDGKLDVASTSFVSNTYSVSVLLGNGDGTLQSARNFMVGSNPYQSIVAIDFNHDGNPDIAAAGPDVEVFLGNGDGTFQPPTQYATYGTPRWVSTSDLNRDGNPDLVVIGDAISVLLGNGDGTFQSHQDYAGGQNPSSVLVADFNLDGKPDVEVPQQMNNYSVIRLGNGDGTLQGEQLLAPDDAGIIATSGDFDLDGKPDLAVVGGAHGPNNVGVLPGNGDGTFQQSQDFLVGTSPYQVAVADFNADGRPDLVTANAYSDNVSVLLNICNPGTTTPTATGTSPTSTSTPSGNPTSTLTRTPPAISPTPSSVTLTPTPQSSNTPAQTNTAVPTNTPQPNATPTDCANPFIDISGNTFYGAIHYLNCRGVINGTDARHYSPAGTATRGQFAKIVVLGFGLPFYTPGTPDFSDVLPTYFAYLYIESGYHAAILSGFDAGSCTAHGAASPCYLPNLAITRGQLTKLVVNAAHYPLYTPSSGQDFTDVPPTNVFYGSIETAYHMGVIAGYADHSFRPSNPIRRDEMAQIVFKGVTTP